MYAAGRRDFCLFSSSECYRVHCGALQSVVEWMSFTDEEIEAQLGLRWHGQHTVGTGWSPVVWLPRLRGISHSNLVFEPNTDGTSPGKREEKLTFWEKPPSPPAFPWDVSEVGLSARAPIASHLAASLNSHCFPALFRTSPLASALSLFCAAVLSCTHFGFPGSHSHPQPCPWSPSAKFWQWHCPRSHFPPFPGAHCASSAEEMTWVSISTNLWSSPNSFYSLQLAFPASSQTGKGGGGGWLGVVSERQGWPHLLPDFSHSSGRERSSHE